LDEAAASLDEAIVIAHKNDELCQLAELHRLKGEMATLAANWDLAEAEFTKSLAVANSQSSKAWELRAATSLAKLCRETGRLNQGRDKLATAYAWFGEGFHTADLKTAKSELEAAL
jgi:predicted ATPase